jgi:pyruvate kinase
VVQAACQVAAYRGVDVIVTVTRTGETARLAAEQRPAQLIVALAHDPETYRRLVLVRGVRPLLLPTLNPDPAELIERARRAARARGWPDMRGVFVSHDRLSTGRL